MGESARRIGQGLTRLLHTRVRRSAPLAFPMHDRARRKFAGPDRKLVHDPFRKTPGSTARLRSTRTPAVPALAALPFLPAPELARSGKADGADPRTQPERRWWFRWREPLSIKRCVGH